MSFLQVSKQGQLLLQVYVQPKASRTQLTGLHGDALKLSVAAPPVDGKANEAVLHYIAKLLGLPKSALSIKSGHQGRAKRLVIEGLDLSEARTSLAKHLPSSS